jgi:protein involved in polysaccharide export with SLBB domain
MTRNRRVTLRARVLLAVSGILVLAAPRSMIGAQSASDSVAFRLLAGRVELTTLANGTSKGAHRDEAERRLREGDFRAGDLLLLAVQGEPTLSDTFMVDQTGALMLPSPVTGPLPMHGVLRSEAREHIRGFIARFINAPVIEVRPLVRLSFEGEVARAGFYAVPADAPLTDVLMAPGGVTAAGDLAKLRISRDGRTLLAGRALRDAFSRGATVDAACLRDGDALSVGRGRGDLEGKLRFLWVIVSLTGGIYGLTRAL